MNTVLDNTITLVTPSEVINYLDLITKQRWNKATVKNSNVTYRIGKGSFMGWLGEVDTTEIKIKYRHFITNSTWIDTINFFHKDKLVIIRERIV